MHRLWWSSRRSIIWHRTRLICAWRQIREFDEVLQFQPTVTYRSIKPPSIRAHYFLWPSPDQFKLDRSLGCLSAGPINETSISINEVNVQGHGVHGVGADLKTYMSNKGPTVGILDHNYSLHAFPIIDIDCPSGHHLKRILLHDCSFGPWGWRINQLLVTWVCVYNGEKVLAVGYENK